MHKNNLIFISECNTSVHCNSKLQSLHKNCIISQIKYLLLYFESLVDRCVSFLYHLFRTNSQLFFVSLMLQRQRAFSPPFLLTFVSFSLREMYKAAAVHTENLNHLRPVSFVLGALKAAADWSRGVQRAPP